ncbi:hypothetical protein GOODEAATRI_030447, partial [Goodea atripinnis]
SWDVFFRNANAGAPPGSAYQSPLGLSVASGLVAPQLTSLVGAQPNVEKLVEDHLAVQSLIRAYQVWETEQNKEQISFCGNIMRFTQNLLNPADKCLCSAGDEQSCSSSDQL